MPADLRDKYPILKQEVSGIADIMVDESILTLADAQWFIEHRAADRMLLKIAKNGGILSTLSLAHYIREAGLKVHLGSHVGETSILSAAARVAAARCQFETIEGSFGTLLLENDITDTPLQFGYGGIAVSTYSESYGLGIAVQELFYQNTVASQRI